MNFYDSFPQETRKKQSSSTVTTETLSSSRYLTFANCGRSVTSPLFADSCPQLSCKEFIAANGPLESDSFVTMLR